MIMSLILTALRIQIQGLIRSIFHPLHAHTCMHTRVLLLWICWVPTSLESSDHAFLAPQILLYMPILSSIPYFSNYTYQVVGSSTSLLKSHKAKLILIKCKCCLRWKLFNIPRGEWWRFPHQDCSIMKWKCFHNTLEFL